MNNLTSIMCIPKFIKTVVVMVTLGGLCLLSLRCQKIVYTLPPNVLFFIVHKNGAPLPDSVNNKLRVFFLKDGVKTYKPRPDLDDSLFLSPAYRYSKNLWGSKVLGSPYFKAEIASTYYLEFPDGDTDTLIVTMGKKLDHDKALKNRCRCYSPYGRVTFNGQEAPEYLEESTSSGKIIYLFEKP